MTEPIIATKADIPEGKDTNPTTGVPNWADNHETVKKFYELSKKLYDDHKAQTLRTNLEDRMDAIDKYCRVVVAPTKQSADKTPDITSWKAPQLMSGIEILTANQCDVLLPRLDPSGKFVPLNELDNDGRAVTQDLMRRRNLQFEYSNEADNRVPKFKEVVRRMNKYGDAVIEMGWLHEEYEIRIPKGKGITATLGWIFKNLVGKGKVKEVRSHSTMRMHDFKDFYCDLLIDNEFDERGSLQNQQGVELRCRTAYGDLLKKQRAGEYKNVEYLSKSQMYEGESPSTTQSTRQTNAGESADTNRATGEMETWEQWAVAPIDDNGNWDEEKTPARWCWGTFCGKLDTQGLADLENWKKGDELPAGMICLRLNPNPYPYDELPFDVQHSKPDDKGLMHGSYYDASKSILEELQKVNNQYIYGKDMMCAAPWKTERGAIFGNKKFDGGPTSLIEMNAGQFAALDRVRVDVNTQDMLAFIQYLERVFWEDIMLMPKGFRGKEMGSRTSATEASAANAQASKPFLERVRYISRLIKFVARKDALYTAYFQPETLTKALTGTTSMAELKPSDVYGPVRYKITCVDDYENNIMEKAEQDRFAQIWMPILAQFIGRRGVIAAGKWAFKKRGAPIDEIFPMPNEGDAIQNANRENEQMMKGEYVSIHPGEDDETHAATHDHFLAVCKTQPPEDSGTALQFVPPHLMAHKQRMAQQAQAIAGAAQQQQQGGPATGLGSGESPAMTAGEASQDMLGAMGGAMAQ